MAMGGSKSEIDVWHCFTQPRFDSQVLILYKYVCVISMEMNSSRLERPNHTPIDTSSTDVCQKSSFTFTIL
jgi:hypothetical protein